MYCLRFSWLLLLALTSPHSLWAHPAWGLVVDTVQQVIYFSDLEQVWRIDAEGKAAIFVHNVHSHDLFLGPSGVLYGEHEWYDEANDVFHTRYWKASPEGRVEDVAWSEARRFFEPHDPKGYGYRIHTSRDSASTWVSKISPAGQAFVLAGGPWGHADGQGREARFRLPGHAVWGPDDHLYMTNGGFVRKMTAAGDVQTIAGPEDGFAPSIQKNGQPRYSALQGLAVAPDGTLYVADIDERKLYRIPPDGTIEAVVTYGPSWMPVGVTIVGDTVYLVEYRTTVSRLVRRNGPRVRKLDAQGTITVVGIAN